ncbi:MAG: RRXRR domain-containing protein [Sarcina sp.]
MQLYSFVKDNRGNTLAPCLYNKAWFLIRKKKARLLQKYPMAIELTYEVDADCETEIVCGIDDGSSATCC